MKSKSIAFCSILLVMLLVLLLPVLVGGTVTAQESELCYAVADRSAGDPSWADQLVSIDRVSGTITAIGSPDTRSIEAIAFDTDGETLYAADADQLGILSLSDGSFAPLPSQFGTGGDGDGNEIEFDDVDGLAIDPATGDLYGTHRQDNTNDVLIKIDKTSGAHIPNAFGPGVDYLVVGGPTERQDVDDIAIDPVDGTMYAAANDGGDLGDLITIQIDTSTSTLTTAVIGSFGVDDIEGIAFFPDGNLYGSTGKYSNATPDTENKFYLIDEVNGSATFLWSFTASNSDYTDYEALGCLTEPTSVALSTMTASSGDGMVRNLGLLLGLMALASVVSIAVWRRRAPAMER